MPMSASWRGSVCVMKDLSSQPSLIFAVTGMSTASTIAFAHWMARFVSQRSIDPPFVLVTLSTGHPMLMSMVAAPWLTDHIAACASVSGCLP